MNKLIITTILMTAIFASGVLAQGIGGSGSIEGTVTIEQATCGLSVTGPLDFSSIIPGQASLSPTSISVANNGNVPTSSLTVYGTEWCDSSGWPSGQTYCVDATPNMPAGQTYIIDGSTGGTYVQCAGSGATGGCPMSTTAGTVFGGVIPASGSVTPYFYLTTVPLSQTAGAYYQTITFTSGC